MEKMGQYYHLFANGNDAQDFITSEVDFRVAFNRFAICAALFPRVRILAFSIEESHPHSLIYSSYEDCIEFKRTYERLTLSYIVANRGSKDGVVFELEISEVVDEDYLRNVGTYVLVQPTKDGKQIMPYDYRWGTASMYFRSKEIPQLWCYDGRGGLSPVVQYGSLSYRERRLLTHSSVDVPDDWHVCNGVILPSNYIAVDMFEEIYKTFNRFRVHFAAGKKQQQCVVDTMAVSRGITMEDIEARKLAYEVSYRMFSKKDSRWLSLPQRLQLAKELRYSYHISIRQIATLSRLPESEIRKYMR